MDNLYDVLQVHPKAEPEVIRAAFRALARKHHPDLGGDPRRMMLLTDAWRILGDRRSRARYDAGLRARAAAAVRSTPPATTSPNPQPTRPASTPDPVSTSAPAPEAPPSTTKDGTVLDFGRYAGWSVRELAYRDPDYLEWLKRTPIGRRLVAEIETHQRAVEVARPTPTPVRSQGLRFRRPTFARA